MKILIYFDPTDKTTQYEEHKVSSDLQTRIEELRIAGYLGVRLLLVKSSLALTLCTESTITR